MTWRRPPKGPSRLAVTSAVMYGTVSIEAKFHLPAWVGHTYTPVAAVRLTSASSPSEICPAIGAARLAPILPS
ncbi:hypothetical protein D3C86_367640 [compost metagenome]